MNDSRCTLVCCTFDRERANRGPGRRSLTPLYSPAAATRDAAVGGTYPTVSVDASPLGNGAPALAAHGSFPSLASRENAASNPALTTAGGLYSPAVTTRDVTAGGSTSSAAFFASAPEPRTGGLGGGAVLDASPAKGERSAGYPTGHGVRQGLANAVAAQLPSHLSATATAGEAVPVDASSAYTSGADGPEPPSRWRAPTSSVCHGDTVPEPVGRLGDVVTLDAYPGPVGRVSGLTGQFLASARVPRLWGWS